MRELPTSLPNGVVLEKPGKNLDSLAPTDAIIELRATLIHEWKIRHKFDGVAQYGIKPTTLALFHGPPGNGKTQAAKMLAKAIDAPLYRVSCEGLLHSHLGQSEKNMGLVMDFLAKAGECVVLFDECEAIFRSRKQSVGECSKAIANTMQIFWQALDRWESPQTFLLATNIRDDIDEAMLSRCEVQLEFVGPTREQAQVVLEYWMDMLHEYGADVWGPEISASLKRRVPVSFRELWQMISGRVRRHIIAMAKD